MARFLTNPLELVRSTHRVAEALELGSPWADSSGLEAIVWDELYPGAAGLPVTRAEAMAVPAVAAARHRLAGTIARFPLRAYRAGEPLEDQPVWTYRADSVQSPAHRLAWTVDDLIFHGRALWAVERDREAQVVRATHVPQDRWSIDPDTGGVLLDLEPMPPGTAVLIDGLHEGICTFGADSIRGAAGIRDAAVDTARHPMRLEMHDTGDYPMTRAEQRELVADAKNAMRETGGVIYTSPGVEAKLHPVSADQLLVAGRESFAVDIARLIGVPAAIIDAYSNGATMTYSTTQDVIAAFLHLGLTLYMTPITARLSLDDVAPRGTEIRFEADAVLGIEALTTPPVREPSA